MPLPGILASSFRASSPAFQGDYWALNSVTLSSSASSVTFTGIPQNYTHLQIRCLIRSATAATTDSTKFNFNGDTGSNYMRHALYGDGASAGAAASATSTTFASLGDSTAASATASVFGTYVLDILDYANTNKYKTTRAVAGYDLNGSGNIDLRSNLWMSTSAITSITFVTTSSSNFAQYSSFALYGVK
jgi:hypothetical protein